MGAFEGSHAAQFGGGLYGAADTFRDSSESLHFGFGEGLPGKAWAAGHPVILKDFSGSGSERVAAAKAAGLTCAAGLPVFAGEFLMAVVVFFCGADDKHVGAIELWHHDPAISNDLRFADGYFGTADTFEFNARHAKFPRGYGLPGSSVARAHAANHAGSARLSKNSCEQNRHRKLASTAGLVFHTRPSQVTPTC